MAFLGTAVLLIVSILLMMYCVMALGKWRGKVASGIGGAVFGMEMAFLPWCIHYVITGGDSSASPFRGASLDSPIRNLKFFVEAHAEFARKIIISGLQNRESEDFFYSVFFLVMLLICAGVGFAFMYSLSEEIGNFGALWAIVGVGVAADIIFFVLIAIATLVYVIVNDGGGIVGMILLWTCVAALLGGGTEVVVLVIKEK